jgi:hypothetical protein
MISSVPACANDSRVTSTMPVPADPLSNGRLELLCPARASFLAVAARVLRELAGHHTGVSVSNPAVLITLPHLTLPPWIYGSGLVLPGTPSLHPVGRTVTTSLGDERTQPSKCPFAECASVLWSHTALPSQTDRSDPKVQLFTFATRV